MASTLQDLNAVITSVGTAVVSQASLSPILKDVVTQVIAILQTNPGGVDYTNQVVALQSMLSTLNSNDADFQTAIDALKKALGQ